jgi:hypothetical protein
MMNLNPKEKIKDKYYLTLPLENVIISQLGKRPAEC